MKLILGILSIVSAITALFLTIVFFSPDQYGLIIPVWIVISTWILAYALATLSGLLYKIPYDRLCKKIDELVEPDETD